MDENAELIRKLVKKYDLEIVVAPRHRRPDRAGPMAAGSARFPPAITTSTRQIPATDKDVAQVDTLVMTNACVGRAERVAFLNLLGDEFPNFVRANPPPSPRSQDAAPLADEAREFFANGQPALPTAISRGS